MPQPDSRSRVAAVALGAGLAGYSATAGSAIPGRRNALVQAIIGAVLAVAFRAQPGLRGPQFRVGLRHGAGAAAVIGGAVAAGTAIPAVRTSMSKRALPQPIWRWLLLDIPVGTVLSEEAAYRGALGTVAAAGFGARGGRLLQAVAFGLSHIPDARGTGEPVLGTVLATGAAGWVFAALQDRSGSLLAPILAHLAVNEAGAIAARIIQRHNGI